MLGGGGFEGAVGGEVQHYLRDLDRLPASHNVLTVVDILLGIYDIARSLGVGLFGLHGHGLFHSPVILALYSRDHKEKERQPEETGKENGGQDGDEFLFFHILESVCVNDMKGTSGCMTRAGSPRPRFGRNENEKHPGTQQHTPSMMGTAVVGTDDKVKPFGPGENEQLEGHKGYYDDNVVHAQYLCKTKDLQIYIFFLRLQHLLSCCGEGCGLFHQ